MSLTPEDFRRIAKNNKEFMDKWHQDCEEARKQELMKKGIIMQESSENQKENFHGDCDHPNTMENEAATVLYIFVMLGGLIFNAKWIIWIVATVIYFKFITRHKK